MTKEQLEIILTARDMASKVLNGVGGSVTALNNKLGGLAKDGFNKVTAAGKAMTTGLMIGIPLIAGLLGGVGVGAIRAAGQFETMKVALNTAFQGNESVAKSAFDQINAFTAKNTVRARGGHDQFY